MDRGKRDQLERSIIIAAQAGSRPAFESLVRSYFPRLYRAAYGILRNGEDASDICQEVFIRVYRNLSRFDVNRSFYPWAYRILKNLCINRLRRRKRMADAADGLENLESRYPLPDSEVILKEEAELFRRALDSLPRMHREILILKTYGDASYREIAEILSIPIGTVMSRLYNARMKLKAQIEVFEGEEVWNVRKPNLN